MTATEPPASSPRSTTSRPSGSGRSARAAVRFARHYVEMVLAMAAGMVLLSPPLAALVRLGLSTEAAEAPAVAAVSMTLAMAVGMAIWMWYRGHPSRHRVLMAAAMLAPAVAGGLLVKTGVLAAHSAAWSSHLAMLALMLAVMALDPAAYLRPPLRRRRLGPLLRHGGFVLVALAVVVGIGGVGLIRQTAAAYSPPPATEAPVPAPEPARHDPAKPTAAIVVGAAGAEVGDVLGPYETLSATHGFNVYSVAPAAGPVPLTGGLDLLPQLTFTELEQRLGPDTAPEVVVVPAMPDAGQPTNTPVVDWLRHQHRGGSQLLAVCNGARILAATGLLDGRPATSHWIRLTGLRQAYPHVRWQSRTRYVDDGSIITTGGILSGIDGSLRVVERTLGAEPAVRTARAVGWRHYHPGTPAELPPSTLAPADLVAVVNAGYRWNRPTLGVLLTDGVGELELVSVFDPYAGQSFAVTTLSVSADGPIRTRHGLTLLPRADLTDAAPRIDRLLVPGHETSQHPAPPDAAAAADLTPHYLHAQPGFPLDAGLRDLAATVDVRTASWAAKMLEYPTTDLHLIGPRWPWRPALTALLTLIGILALLNLGTHLWRRISWRVHVTRVDTGETPAVLTADQRAAPTQKNSRRRSR